VSWNGADLFVAGGRLEDVPGLTPAGPSGGFGESDAAARTDGGWLHVHCESRGLGLAPHSPATVRADGRVVLVRYSGVADVHTLEVADGGTLVRRVVRSQGEVVVDEGPALPEEDAEPVEAHDPEEWTFRVLARLTGVEVRNLPGTTGWQPLAPTTAPNPS
jgi:hypothetical protein